jgi:acyl carrier protein
MSQQIDEQKEISHNYSSVEPYCTNTCNVMDTLKSILIDLGIPEELLDEDTLLHKDLQLDSVETVEIALGLKRKLGVNVKLETRQDITIAQVCNTVKAAIATSPK